MVLRDKEVVTINQSHIGGYIMTREISINTLKEMNVSTFSKKDNSVRGCTTVSKNEIQIGDEVVIDNYFTLVIA